MSKLFKDHPAYQRVQNFIEDQVLACRPNAIRLAIAHVTQRAVGVSPQNYSQKVAEQVDYLENQMAKRLRRYYGLNGKYVGH